MHKILFEVKEEDKNTRLDLVIVLNSNELSRSQVRNYIDAGKVLVNDQVEFRPNIKVEKGSRVEVRIESEDIKPNQIAPENIPLDILYEDKDLVVINKPAGLVTHPATGNWSGTLLNGLLFHFKDLVNVGDNIRSGLIHRLDKETSGLVLVGKTAKGLWYYSRLFAERGVQKTYIAMITGNIDQIFKERELKVTNYLGRNPKFRTKYTKVDAHEGRFSESDIKLIRKFKHKSQVLGWVEVRPKTGRTHQIRVHLSGLGCPILGDKLYGKNNQFPRMMLHAWKIEIVCLDGQKREFEAPIPPEFNIIARNEYFPKSNK